MIILKQLQGRLMEIIDYITELCEKHNITYYLVAGSALGAVRHSGFIPWDDDIDIGMLRGDYNRFLQACEKELDIDRFYLQKGQTKGWPMNFTKVRMNGTVFEEFGVKPSSHQGIYIDVFPLDNVSDTNWFARCQYICSKILIAQSLAQRGYSTARLHKKIAMLMSFIFFPLQPFLRNVVEHCNVKKTKQVAMFFGRVRFRTAIFPIYFLGDGVKVDFEGYKLLIPKEYGLYLTNLYGNYMELPPKDQQIGHLPQNIKL